MIVDFKRASLSAIAVAALVSVGIALPYQLAAAGVPAQGLGTGSLAAAAPLVNEVKNYKGGKGGKNVYVKKSIYVNKGGGKNWYVKRWNRKPYYGNIIAGVALGTLIGVTAVGVAPAAPSEDLCWYWSSPAHNRGYWDYCY